MTNRPQPTAHVERVLKDEGRGHVAALVACPGCLRHHVVRMVIGTPTPPTVTCSITRLDYPLVVGRS